MPLKPLDENTCSHVPYPDDGIQRACSDKLPAGGDGDRGYTRVAVE